MNACLEQETRETGFVVCVPVLYRDGRVVYVAKREHETSPDADAIAVVYEKRAGRK